MNIQNVTPILNVSSIRETFAWFEQLGWKKHWEYGEPPDFGGVISGRSEIFLCQGGQGARGGPAAPGTLGQPGREYLDDLVGILAGGGRCGLHARREARYHGTLAAD